MGSIDFHKLPVKNRIEEIHCIRRLSTQGKRDTESECPACFSRSKQLALRNAGSPGRVGNNATHFRHVVFNAIYNAPVIFGSQRLTAGTNEIRSSAINMQI